MTRTRRTLPRHVRWLVYARDGAACALCGARGELHLDHVVPWSQGGDDTTANLRPLCARCNLTRGTSTTADDHTTRPPVGASCADCDPDRPVEGWGYCYQCRQYGDVSRIDRCPDVSRCNCTDIRKYARRSLRRQRRTRRHSRL
ncbi:HNH endonuclease [Tomitella gaofuii]|uniref:HNH endonuclease n=1 Tax=Tomitella gaofuii TaxID=2760083 RepID=UPI0015F817EA|nr:HNH endonuclease signature motif containing protein [Tomitella gaofuii]